MKLLVVISTEEKIDHLYDLSEAAHKRGHEVFAFFNNRSVNLLKGQSVNKGSYSIFICRTSATQLDVVSSDLPEHAQMSSLGELVDLIGDSDRVVFLG